MSDMIEIPDVIRRKDAIDAVGNMLRRKFGIGGDLAEITLACLPSVQDEIAKAVAAVIEQPEEDCDSCKYGYFWDQKCNTCRVGYPSYYERKTDDIQ